MSSKRQRYLYRPLYRGLVRPLGYCLLTPLVVILVTVDICRECCCPSARSRPTYRSPLESQREFDEMCQRLEKEYTPRPLLSDHRPRPLTSCGDHDEKKETSAANPQDQSPFFAKLPAELRLRIYHEILGGNVIHLLLKPGRIGHVVCSGDPSVVRTPGDPDRRCIAAYTVPRELQLQQHQLDRMNNTPSLSTDNININGITRLRHPDRCAVFALDENVYRLYSTHHRAHDDNVTPYPSPSSPSHRLGTAHHHHQCTLHQPQSLLPNHLLPSRLLPSSQQQDHSTNPNQDPKHPHSPTGPPPTTTTSSSSPSSSAGLLAALLTCRRAYREAVPILYQANVFDANHPQTLVLFARTVLPHRLAAVRELQVRWSWRLRERAHARAPAAWWGELWADVVAPKMPGLRAVYLRLDLEGRRGLWAAGAAAAPTATGDASEEEVLRREEEALLGPVARTVRGLRRVEVAVEVEGPGGLVRESGHRPSGLREELEEIVCGPRGDGGG